MDIYIHPQIGLRGCLETISDQMMIRYQVEKLGHRQLQLVGDSTEEAGNNTRYQ